MVRKIVIMTTINKEVIEAFVSTLQDLTVNSKPLINVLTMIADENETYSKNIVEAIETHLSKVRLEVKLPILYLIDCIIKNVGRSYTQHFCQNIVSTFCGVFEVVDEKTRAEMFKLRQTWNDVLPKGKLYAMDVQIRKIDPAWPITTHLHTITTANTIHVNPRFLNATANSLKKDQQQSMAAKGGVLTTVPVAAQPLNSETFVMQQKLLRKQKELVELQQKKVELELLQTRVKLEEEKLKCQLVSSKSSTKMDALPPPTKSHNILLKPEVAKQLDNGNDDTTAATIKSNSNSKIGNSSYPAVIQSYTIPKQQQAARYGAASSRDPRLLRLQQQQLNAAGESPDTDATNIRAAPEMRKVIGGANLRNTGAIMKFGGRLANKHNSSATKRPPKYNNKTAPVDASSSSSSSSSSSKPKKRNLPSLTDCDALTQQEQQKTARTKSMSNVRNDAMASSSAGSSPTKQRLEEAALHVAAEDDGAVVGKFRDLKGANKRRNYVRRNNNRQQQQQTLDDAGPRCGQVKEVIGDGGGGDVDLRSLDTFGVVVGAALTSKLNQSAKLDVAQKGGGGGGDVDLRQIPVTNADKKRGGNSDNADSPPTKKSKSQVLDALFGSEDVDLRQSTVPTSAAARATTPPPPPPPIISSAKSMSPSTLTTDHHREEQPTQSAAAPVAPMDNKDVKKANLDALRAKLASVSNKEKLKEQQKRKQTKEQRQDTIETVPSKPLSAGAETLESAIIRKIIMSSDDVDSIKAGKLSKEQENAIMAKIKSHFENEKLAQAKLKEKEEQEDQQQQQQQQGQSERHEDREISDDDEVVEVLATSSQSNDLPVPAAPSVGGALLGADGRFPPRTRGGTRVAHARALQSGRSGSNRWGPATNPTTWQQGNSKGGRWGGATNHIIPPPPPPIPPLVDYNSLMQQQEQQQQEQPILLQCTNPDDARSINIDGCPRDIRFYDQTAIVFMSWDDPREISFQHGARRAIFDDSDAFLLQLNDTEYTNVAISGQMHRIRLGAPTRELWIDGNHYEAIFGGKQIALEIDGRVAMVQLEGPPPQVRIGTERRLDLVAGKIQLIVDAKIIIPVFLDARVQQIAFGVAQQHQVQFVDGLRGVRFDGGAVLPVEFGGLPKAVYLRQRKHFVRFSVLPRGVRPGVVRIQGMDGDGGRAVCYESPAAPMPHMPSAEELAGVPVAPAPAPSLSIATVPVDESSLDSQHNLGGNFDALSNAANVSLNTSESEYHVESQLNNQHSTVPPSLTVATSAADSPVVPPIEPSPAPKLSNILNINDLFQKLIATGIVSTQHQPPKETQSSTVEKQQQQQQHKTKRKSNPVAAEVPPPVLLPIQWNKPDTLKTRQTGLVQLLYSGLQCNSCGERFPPVVSGGSRLFSQHLDWHFRQNRRGKNSARNRKATSRRWYYSLADWRQYEEIEDLKERAEKNFFETQQQQQQQEESGGETTAPSQDTVSDQHQHSAQSAHVFSSVAADPETTDPHCVVCEDRFEQFYNEELEEWHLRNAVAVDGQIYHPVCYKDHQQSTAQISAAIPGLDLMVEQEGKDDIEMDENASSSVEEIQVIDDDDDDVAADAEVKGLEDTPELELLIAPEESVKESGREEERDEEVCGDDGDDDVILNEVQPEQIILDEYQWRGPEPSEDELLSMGGGGGGLIPGVVVKIEPIDDGFMDVGDSLQKAPAKDKSEQIGTELSSSSSSVVVVAGAVETCAAAHDQSTVVREAINSEETMVVDDDDDDDQDQVNKAKVKQVEIAAVLIDKVVDKSPPPPPPQQHQAEQMMASIDGNIDMNNKMIAVPGLTSIGPVAALAPSGRIRINISKVHNKGAVEQQQKNSSSSNSEPTSAAAAMTVSGDDVIRCGGGDVSVGVVDPSQPLPPGEEPPLKPALRALTLRRQPPVHTGTELTGLCSVM